MRIVKSLTLLLTAFVILTGSAFSAERMVIGEMFTNTS
jgi:hypothetical protein